MANRVITLSGLTTYDSLIKALIASQDSETYELAKNYIDESIAENCQEITSEQIAALFTE